MPRNKHTLALCSGGRTLWAPPTRPVQAHKPRIKNKIKSKFHSVVVSVPRLGWGALGTTIHVHSRRTRTREEQGPDRPNRAPASLRSAIIFQLGWALGRTTVPRLVASGNIESCCIPCPYSFSNEQNPSRTNQLALLGKN